MKPPVLLLAARKCSECLVSPRRIVPNARALQLINDCTAEENHFICHKGSMVGQVVHCRGVHDLQPSRAYHLARALGVEVREVDPDNLEPASE